MKGYFALFRTCFISGLQYRAAAWAGVCTQFFWGMINIMVFRAFYASSSSAAPMSLSQLASYIWLQQAFLSLVAVWSQDGELFDDIQKGGVAYALCRPYELSVFWFMRLLARRFSNVALRFAPVLAVACLLPSGYRLTPPAGAVGFGLFALSIILAGILMTVISLFMYVLTMVTLSAAGARTIIGLGAEFFAGGLLPIPLMPAGLQKALNFLPFRYTADLPFRIYSGHIPAADAGRQILIQLFFILALGALAFFCFRRAVGRVVIQGG